MGSSDSGGRSHGDAAQRSRVAYPRPRSGARARLHGDPRAPRALHAGDTHGAYRGGSLARHGYQVTDGIGETGVVGLLRNGDGPTVMLRADMDALPVREQTGLPYASTQTGTDGAGKTVPVMHACGHDMHVTWLMGAATILADT